MVAEAAARTNGSVARERLEGLPRVTAAAQTLRPPMLTQDIRHGHTRCLRVPQMVRAWMEGIQRPCQMSGPTSALTMVVVQLLEPVLGLTPDRAQVNLASLEVWLLILAQATMDLGQALDHQQQTEVRACL